MFRHSLFIILASFSICVGAQHPVPLKMNSNNDSFSSFEKNQLAYLYETYSQFIDPSYDLINGREYMPYYFNSDPKPIFFSDKPHSSSITINGKRFEDLTLDYDTYLREVIYIDSSRFFIYRPLRVALNKYNVDSFEFYYSKDTTVFRYFSKSETAGFNLSDGFYEVVYDGDSKYLIEHTSYLFERDGANGYNYTPAGFVNVGNGFYKIRNKRQFARLFGERSNEVKKFIEKSRISVRNADKRQIMSVLNFFDNLNN